MSMVVSNRPAEDPPAAVEIPKAVYDPDANLLLFEIPNILGLPMEQRPVVVLDGAAAETM